MTSKKSFFNILLFSIKERVWGIVLACLGFFFVLPVYGGMYLSIIHSEALSNSYRMTVVNRLYRNTILGENNYMLIMLTVVLAAFFAIYGFSYVFSKQKIDLYHSAPIKRERFFAFNFAAGIICFIVPYIIMLILAIVIGAANGVMDGTGIYVALITFGINVLGFILMYAVFTVVVMLTGTVAVAVLGSFVFALYGPIINGLMAIYKSTFFTTYSSYDETNGIIGNISPVTYYIDVLGKINSFSKTPGVLLKPSMIIILILVIVIITFAAGMLYKIRPSEAAGVSMAFKKTKPFISIALLVPISMYGALIFSELSGTNVKDNYGWFIFGLLFSLLFAHAVVQTVYYADIKALIKNMENPGIALVIVGVAVSVFVFDIGGYDSFIPNDNAYDSYSISGYDLQGSQDYYDFEKEENEWGYKDFWVDMDEYRFENEILTDKEFLKDLVNVAIKESKDAKEAYENENSSETHWVNFNLKYNMKNRRPIYRAYSINLREHMDLYDRLYSQQEYKNGVFPILKEDMDVICENLQYFNSVKSTEFNNLTMEEKKELVDTYKKELLAQNAYDLQNSFPIGYIYTDNKIEEDGYMSDYYSNKGYVYPSFTNTIALLEKYGVDLYGYSDVENVSYIEVYNYHYNEPDNMATEYYVEPDMATYNEKSQIVEIFTSAIPSELASVDGALHDMGDLEVTAYYENVKYGENPSIMFSFEKGKIPEFVSKDVKYNENI